MRLDFSYYSNNLRQKHLLNPHLMLIIRANRLEALFNVISIA